MPKLSKKQKQEWNFFINPKTGRRTYNELCKKCVNDCKQSYHVVIASCGKFRAKRQKYYQQNKGG